MSDIIDKVRELSRIKADIAKLNDRRKELEAYFLERGGDDVVDTKFKSTVYADPDSQAAVTYTEAQALTIVYPHYLKETLGAMFPDIFEESVKTEIKPKNKDIERMLIGMFTGNYTRSTPEEIIAQLPCGDKAKSALAKKLKGAKFETDRDNLMKIGVCRTGKGRYGNPSKGRIEKPSHIILRQRHHHASQDNSVHRQKQ